MTAVLPDAHRANWVDRFAPPVLQPWLKLGRFDRPAGIWLLMLPGWQGIALAGAMDRQWPDALLMLKVFVCPASTSVAVTVVTVGTAATRVIPAYPLSRSNSTVGSTVRMAAFCSMDGA